jgi:hypothetical protein
MKHRLASILVLVAAPCLFLICSFILGAQLKNGIASKSWSSVEGKILEFKADSLVGDLTVQYSIRYRYLVMGKEFEASKFSYMIFDGSVDKVKEMVQLGSDKCLVFYDPQKPQDAVLYPGINAGLVVFFLIFAFPSLMFACLLLVISWKAGKQRMEITDQ